MKFITCAFLGLFLYSCSSIQSINFDKERSPSSINLKNCKKSINKLITKFQRPEIDLDKFEHSLQALKRGNFQVTDNLTLEEKFAVLEYSAKPAGVSYSDFLSRPLKDKQRKAVIKFASKLDFKKGVSSYDIETFFAKIYALRFKEGNSLFKLKRFSKNRLITHYIRQNLERYGLEKTLKKLGLIQDKSRWQKLKHFLFRSNVGSWLMFGMTNTHILYTNIKIPLGFPKKFGYRIPDNVMKEMLNGSSQDIVEALSSSYGRKIQYFHIKERIKKIAPMVTMSAIGLYFYLNPDEFKQYIKDATYGLFDTKIDQFFEPVKDDLDKIEEGIARLENKCIDYQLAKDNYFEMYQTQLEDDIEVRNIILLSFGLTLESCQ